MDKKMHNFEQVKDVLDYSVELHSQLHDIYKGLADATDQERLKMLLDYLSRHERALGAATRRFEQEHPGRTLNTWLQFAPSDKLENLLKACAVHPEMDVNDVVTTALAFDNALIEIYKEAGREADDPQVQALFENLAQNEEKEKERFIRDAGWLQDL